MNDIAWCCPVQGRAGPFPGWIRLHPICMTHGAHMRCITAPLQMRGARCRTPLVCPQSLRAQLLVKHPRRLVVSPFLALPCVSGREHVLLPVPKAQRVMQSCQPPLTYKEPLPFTFPPPPRPRLSKFTPCSKPPLPFSHHVITSFPQALAPFTLDCLHIMCRSLHSSSHLVLQPQISQSVLLLLSHDASSYNGNKAIFVN